MLLWWTHSQRGGERLSMQEDPERSKVAGLANILHISVLVGAVKYPHSWNWRWKSPQRVVRWVASARVHMCMKLTHIAALTHWLKQKQKAESRCRLVAHACATTPDQAAQQWHGRSLLRRGWRRGKTEGRWREMGLKMFLFPLERCLFARHKFVTGSQTEKAVVTWTG